MSTLTNLNNSRVYATNAASTSPILFVPFNTSRGTITFHNPGPIAGYVFPAMVLSQTTGQNVPLAASLAALGGCFMVNPGATLFIGGSSAKQEWHLFSASGSGNPFTASEE